MKLSMLRMQFLGNAMTASEGNLNLGNMDGSSIMKQLGAGLNLSPMNLLTARESKRPALQGFHQKYYYAVVL